MANWPICSFCLRLKYPSPYHPEFLCPRCQVVELIAKMFDKIISAHKPPTPNQKKTKKNKPAAPKNNHPQ